MSLWRALALLSLLFPLLSARELREVGRNWAPDAHMQTFDAQEAAPEGPTLGFFLAAPPVGDSFLAFETEDGDGTWTGFDVDIAKEVVMRITGGDIDAVEVVRIANLEDRINFLRNGTVDWVLGSFTVSPERQKIVDFCLPYYYSSGTALFAPGGKVDGVERWDDLSGMPVAIRIGHYSTDYVLQYGFIPVWVYNAEEAAAAVAEGTAAAYVDDDAIPQPQGLSRVESLGSILVLPYGIAVRKGNTELAERISAALMDLVKGGEGAKLLEIEKETLGKAGMAPNKHIEELVADPTGPTFLNPGPQATAGHLQELAPDKQFEAFDAELGNGAGEAGAEAELAPDSHFDAFDAEEGSALKAKGSEGAAAAKELGRP